MTRINLNTSLPDPPIPDEWKITESRCKKCPPYHRNNCTEPCDTLKRIWESEYLESMERELDE